MTKSVLVQIVGAPIACKDGVKDSWRGVSVWVAGQLQTRFGEIVQVQYYDLFDEDCPLMPENVQLPLVLIEGAVISNGDKISMPLIRQIIEKIMNQETV
jgi:hypothetical protein